MINSKLFQYNSFIGACQYQTQWEKSDDSASKYLKFSLGVVSCDDVGISTVDEVRSTETSIQKVSTSLIPTMLVNFSTNFSLGSEDFKWSHEVRRVIINKTVFILDSESDVSNKSKSQNVYKKVLLTRMTRGCWW